MKNVKIYQIKDEVFETCGYVFRGFDFAEKFGFSMNDYECVYSCYRDDNYGNESAFREFNVERPNDFEGHSLSVSDIVEIDGVRSYCDSFGWCSC